MVIADHTAAAVCSCRFVGVVAKATAPVTGGPPAAPEPTQPLDGISKPVR